jgi:hypothetical protein
MNIILINWKHGENNPFSYFNHHLKILFEEFGCLVNIVDLDEKIGENIARLNRSRKVNLAITHQGLGSNLKVVETKRLLWEELEIKLVCLHGDHPCHAPLNHTTDSSYILHTYCIPAFAAYANRYFQRRFPAIFLGLPSMFRYNETVHERDGDYFVFPKNLDDLEIIYSEWKRTFPTFLSDFLIYTADEITHNYKLGDPKEHHDIINECIEKINLEEFLVKLNIADRAEFFHLLHATLDKIYRNTISQCVIEELKDIPMHINGRGWDRFLNKKYKWHTYNSFGEVQFGDKQFYTNYGIVDVTPHRSCLHDRTMRALAHHGCFLSNSKAVFLDTKGVPFNTLFYSGVPNDLRAKAEAVMESPQSHLERCKEFSFIINRDQPFEKFYNFLYIAQSINQVEKNSQ